MNTLTKLGLKGMLEHLTETHRNIHGGDMTAYLKELNDGRKALRYSFPGLTIVLAEIDERDYLPSMTHVLAAEPATIEHKIGWHDQFTAHLSLEDGQTTLSNVATCEVKYDQEWIYGTVGVGGPASQSYLLTEKNGHVHVIQFGDVIRNIAFKSEGSIENDKD